MKKLFSILLALTMLLCTACGGDNSSSSGNNAPQSDKIASIFADITDVPADEIVMTVGELEIPADVYFYWICNTARNAEQIYQRYSMIYGQYGHMLNEDSTLNWDAAYGSNMTVGDAVELQAMDNLAYFVVTERMAALNGVTLTDEDAAEIEATIQKNLDQHAQNLIEADEKNAELSAEELEEKYFYTLGIDRETTVRLMSVSYLTEGLIDLMLTEGSSLYVEPENFNDVAYYADHILIATQDLESGRAYTADELAEKRALAEEILAQLQASDDMEALFARLADLHSEDTGRATNPTGYIFMPGQMVEEFENGTAALEPGELSGIIQSDYGYHIILRRDLQEGLELYPEYRDAVAEEYLSALINTVVANSSASISEALNDIDLSEVYSTYMTITGQSGSSFTTADK